MDLVLNNIFNTIFIEKMIWATFVSTGFAILFTTPRRALWATGLLGAVGFSVKYILLHSVLIDHIVVSSFIAAVIVGILGMYFAHRVHTPPVVFTIPAVINMVPGKLGYEFMIGLIKIVSFEKDFDITLPFVYETMNKGLKTGFIMLVLALGVTTPILLFNTYSVKDKDLHNILKRRKERLLKQKAKN
ncbi:MAG: threonine/serine exporter family protein [Flavobacteriaceae bacterium]|nr:threonine/serine exporter family protein [Flavobacteriaceae bacterium]